MDIVSNLLQQRGAVIEVPNQAFKVKAHWLWSEKELSQTQHAICWVGNLEQVTHFCEPFSSAKWKYHHLPQQGCCENHDTCTESPWHSASIQQILNKCLVTIFIVQGFELARNPRQRVTNKSTSQNSSCCHQSMNSFPACPVKKGLLIPLLSFQPHPQISTAISFLTHLALATLKRNFPGTLVQCSNGHSSQVMP